MAEAIEATGSAGGTATRAIREARPVEKRRLGPLEAREVIVRSGRARVPYPVDFPTGQWCF